MGRFRGEWIGFYHNVRDSKRIVERSTRIEKFLIEWEDGEVVNKKGSNRMGRFQIEWKYFYQNGEAFLEMGRFLAEWGGF